LHPILFHVGASAVYSYGVMLFVAFITGTMIGVYLLGKRGVNSSSVYLLAAALALASLVGARLFYVLGHLNEFRWASLLDLNTHGMVFYGGLLLAIPVGVVVVRKWKVPTGVVANAAALALFPAIAIARVGCFLNGCCYGKPSGLPWAVIFPGVGRVHPTQIYEAILDILAFALILVLSRYLDGEWDLFLVALAAYGTIRFVMEFFRAHDATGAGIFFQLLSLAIVAVSIGALFYRRRVAARQLSSGAEEVFVDGA